MGIKKYILSVVVENNPGILARIASLFGRRGYNIDSLTVSETNDPGTSHITLTVTGDEQILEQIIKQASKLVEVFSIRHLSDISSLSRELLLIKMYVDPAIRTQLREIVEIYEAKIVDLAPSAMIVELTGPPQKIDTFLCMMKEYQIIEMCRTGVTAMEKDSTRK